MYLCNVRLVGLHVLLLLVMSIGIRPNMVLTVGHDNIIGNLAQLFLPLDPILHALRVLVQIRASADNRILLNFVVRIQYGRWRLPPQISGLLDPVDVPVVGRDIGAGGRSLVIRRLGVGNVGGERRLFGVDVAAALGGDEWTLVRQGVGRSSSSAALLLRVRNVVRRRSLVIALLLLLLSVLRVLWSRGLKRCPAGTRRMLRGILVVILRWVNIAAALVRDARLRPLCAPYRLFFQCSQLLFAQGVEVRIIGKEVFVAHAFAAASD